MKAIWNVTRLCGWNCLICCVSAVHVNRSQVDDVYETMRDAGMELSFDEKKMIIDELYSNGIESVDLSGGDLLLRQEDIQLLEYAATKYARDCLSISVPGQGLTGELIGQLKQWVSKIEFTIDRMDDVKDGSRPTGYNQVSINAIKLCRENNIDTCVSTVLRRGNSSPENLKQIYDFLKENNVNEWEIIPYYQVGRAADIYALLPSADQMDCAVKYLDGIMTEGFVNISYQHTLKNSISCEVKCNAVSRSIGILPDGTVTACAWATGHNGKPVDDRFILGKLPDEKLAAILSGRKAENWHINKFNDDIAVCQVHEYNRKRLLPLKPAAVMAK